MANRRRPSDPVLAWASRSVPRETPAERRGSAWRSIGRTRPPIGPRRRQNLRPGKRRRGSSDTQTEIAAELGLGGPLTLGQLTSRWRDFVWRHHPDRQPIEARERANARVAIANALYGRARRELAEKR